MAAGVGRVFIWCVAVLATGAVSGTTGGGLSWPLVFREGSVLGLEEGAARLPNAVISATTAVLRAVATVPIDAVFEDHSGPMTQDSAQFARLQSAQTAAAALLASDMLERVLADPHVIGMVRQLLLSGEPGRNDTRALKPLTGESPKAPHPRAGLRAGQVGLQSWGATEQRRFERNGTRVSPRRGTDIARKGLAQDPVGVPQRRSLQASADEEASADGEALLGAFVRGPGNLWNATGWVRGTDPCEGDVQWEGVSCNGARVTNVRLLDTGMQVELLGTVLRQLTKLRVLVIAGGLHGTIPSELGGLTELQELGLGSNPSLSGTIPSELSNLSELQVLDLSSNSLMSGTIPSELSDLSELQVLGLYSNPSLSGTIPSELSDLSELQELGLSSNPSLSGTIPSALSDLSELEVLGLWSNPSLSGTIPSELSDLSELEVLGLYSNPSLSGTIPSELSNLSELQELDLSSNPSLSGTIPRELSNLSELQELFLYSNSLMSGTIPSELSNLSELQELFLYSNSLMSGTIPSELSDLSELQGLGLYSNPSLSGTIPSELSNLSQLQGLGLYSNSLMSGTIPGELSNLSELEILVLGSNPSLSGTIPSELSDLSELQELDLSSNPSLSGTIPSELSNLSELQELYVYSVPLLEGAVPAFDGCAGLRVLDLHNCSLSRVPSTLPGSLTHLYLDHNPLNSRSSKLLVLLRSLDQLSVLDIGFMNSEIVLEPDRTGSRGYGTRVVKPESCHVGEPCAFVLHMYDEYGQPVKQGGLIHNLTLRLGGLSASMRDNHDGSFTAAIPTDWVLVEGSAVFDFAHNGSEFRPRFVERHKFVNLQDCRYATTDTGQLVPLGECTSLRTIEFLPRQCSEAQYDSRTFGVLVCTTGDWKPAESLTGAYAETAARISGGKFCVECPSECTTCNGSVTVREGWRPNIVDEAEVSTLRNPADSLTPLFVFRCPSSTYGNNGSCPQLLLDRTPKATPDGACLANHSGRLCESCERSYSRHSHTCQPCGHDAIKQHFGVSVESFVVCVVASGLAVLALLMKLKVAIKRVKAPVWSLVKIALGLAQVLGLLKDCLNIIYPPGPSRGLNYLQLFTGDVKTLVQFDCQGWDWFDVWRLTVLVVPGLAVAVCCVRYGWQRWRRNPDAQSNAVSSVFFVVMLLYPRVSAGILSALRCRQLGVGLSVLDMDYDVSCSDPRYARYRLCAWVLLVAWPVGIPLGLLALLWRHYQRNTQEFAAMEDQALRSGAKMRQSYGAAEHNRSKLIERYDFCLDSYRPGCWYWEPLDMLRKLALSGLLQFVQRGTAAQVLVGCVLAFGAFGVHVRLLPYRDAEANLLKACAEMLIFLVFLVSFILRVLPRIEIYEPIGVRGYGYMLLCSVGAFMAVLIGLVTKQFYRHHHFQIGLEEFAAGGFGGEEGVELGLLTRGHSQLHADEGGARDGEPTPEPSGVGYTTLAGVEPEPEAQFDEDATHQRRGSKRVALAATV